jgi:hypothetical protein
MKLVRTAIPARISNAMPHAPVRKRVKYNTTITAEKIRCIIL